MKMAKNHENQTMKRQYLAAPMFMILLVISIPFLSSDAFAIRGSLTDLEVKSQGNVSYFVSEYADSAKISIIANIYDDEFNVLDVTTDNLRLYTPGSRSFDSCVETDKGYLCEYETAYRDRDPGIYPFHIKLYDNAGNLLKSMRDSYYVDGQAPQILMFEIPDVITKDFTAKVRLLDSACDDCGFACSGLDRMEFLVNNEVSYDFGLSGCVHNENKKLDGEVMDIPQGETTLCLKVYDKFGHYEESCKTVLYDSGAPTASSDLVFKAGSGQLISHINEQSEALVAMINISEQFGLDTDNVYADFSGINKERAEEYQSMKATCSELSDGLYSCRWAGLVITEVGSIAIPITVRDVNGNTRTIQKTKNIMLDNTKPRVTGISTRYDKYLRRPANNTIILEIAEAGSGMASRKIFLDLTSIGAGTNVQPDYCELQNGMWYCYWEGVLVTRRQAQNMYNVQVISMADAIGNTMEPASVSSETLILDETAPVFDSVDITALGYQRNVLLGTDVAKISARIIEADSELFPENVLADYSEFSPDMDYSPASTCDVLSSTMYECIWEYTGAMVPKTDIKMNIIAMDAAGNIKESSDDGKLGEAYVSDVVDRKTQADFWEENARVSGVSPVNRNFLIQGGTIVRAHLELQPKSGSFVHDFTMHSCIGRLDLPMAEHEKDLSYDSITIFSQYYPPKDIRESKNELELLLSIPPYPQQNDTEAAERIEIICSGELMQSLRRTSDIFTENENINATIIVPLSGGVFDNPGEVAIKKINKKKDDYDRVKSLVSTLEKITKILTPLCSVMNAIIQLANNVCMVVSVVGRWQGNSWGLSCKNSISDNLNDIWTGDFYKFGDSTKGGIYGLVNDGNPSKWGNQKKILSLGYICDLVLCTSCSEIWRGVWSGFEEGKGLSGLENKANNFMVSMFDKDKKDKDPDWLAEEAKQHGGNLEYGTPDEEFYQGVRTTFDPHKSLIVAIICDPPCLSGIQTKLTTYKEILRLYNVCYNTAIVRGDGTHECDKFYKSQVCQQIIMEFWHFIYDFIKQFIVKSIAYHTEKAIIEMTCDTTGEVTPETCFALRIKEALGVMIVMLDSYDIIEGLMSGDLYDTSKDSEKSESDRDELVDKLDKGS